MKEVKQYKCDHCGALYANKSECEVCEGQHAIPRKIVEVLHIVKGVYPTRIDVELTTAKSGAMRLGGDSA